MLMSRSLMTRKLYLKFSIKKMVGFKDRFMEPEEFEKIRKQMEAAVHAHNHRPDPELCGFSPLMLDALARHPWNTPGSPLKLNPRLPLHMLETAPFFRNMRILLRKLCEEEKVKATAGGNFNRRFIESMVTVFLQGEALERTLRMNKVLNEPDVFPLHHARIVVELAGLIRKYKGHFLVVKKQRHLLEDANAGELFARLFETYFCKFNVGYTHGLPEDLDWIQRETGFLLFPLCKVARKWIEVEKLPGRTFHPMVLGRLEDQVSGRKFLEVDDVVRYFFIRPLEDWGLVEVRKRKENYWERYTHLRVTDLYRRFIRFEDPVEAN